MNGLPWQFLVNAVPSVTDWTILNPRFSAAYSIRSPARQVSTADIYAAAVLRSRYTLAVCLPHRELA